MIDVCFCEPFVISGVLPTLGVATLKSALNKENINSKIFYPAVEFFFETKILENKNFSMLLDDIPLQIIELLFCDANTINTKLFSNKTFNDDLIKYIEWLRICAEEKLETLINRIMAYSPKIFCYSFTFGGYNFAKKLFAKLKEKNSEIKIIVGGSNCSPQFSKTLIKEYLEIDYVICDESPDSFVKVVKALLSESIIDISCVTCKEKTAMNYGILKDINALPEPDFDDFFDVVNEYNIAKEFITLPYEISRGCWWCEIKPCLMCGFFGNRRNFIAKTPKKVIKELCNISKKHNVFKFRFSDLVQPKTEYLQELKELSLYNMRFFWELRPDVEEKDISLLRSIGVTFVQIGIESFDTNQLTYINKGTTGIHNIYILLLCASYKIDVVWNYLYGFDNDKQEWYENALEIMPLLHHLQPPKLRKVWINKFSDVYDGGNYNQEQSFFDFKTNEFQIFYTSDNSTDELNNLYKKLEKEIADWQKDFTSNYGIYIDEMKDDYIKLTVIREEKSIYELIGIQAQLYRFFMHPRTLDDAVEEFDSDINTISNCLNYFIENKLMLNLDENFLSLAVKGTKYRYTKDKEQVLYLSEKIYE